MPTTDHDDGNSSSKSVLIQLGLRQNAYDFVEEALRYAERGSEDPVGWKFAIILAAQAIELLLKARLADEHPLLVRSRLESADVGSQTVGVGQAIERLHAAGIRIDDQEKRRLLRAQRLRNEFVHYEVKATVGQLESAFADLFEFAHFFHSEHLQSELHDHLSEDLYAAEAAMMSRFRREFVTYQGSTVIRWFPSEIVDAQFALRLRIGNKVYDRIRRGSTRDLFGQREPPCHDCSVVQGQLHAHGCDSERCPACDGQLFGCGCGCDWEWEYDETIDRFVPGDNRSN